MFDLGGVVFGVDFEKAFARWAAHALVFFDDTLENVEGARGIGMTAVHVRSVSDIQRRVSELLST